MIKEYRVYYWIKANKHEYLKSMVVVAGNAKEACKECKRRVYAETGRNAFRPSTTAPSETELEALHVLE